MSRRVLFVVRKPTAGSPEQSIGNKARGFPISSIAAKPYYAPAGIVKAHPIGTTNDDIDPTSGPGELVREGLTPLGFSKGKAPVLVLMGPLFSFVDVVTFAQIQKSELSSLVALHLRAAKLEVLGIVTSLTKYVLGVGLVAVDREIKVDIVLRQGRVDRLHGQLRTACLRHVFLFLRALRASQPASAKTNLSVGCWSSTEI